MNWINVSSSDYKSVYKENAIGRQSMLTKPPGSLGMLEDVAIRLADVQQTDCPSVEKVSIAIFAADHGVAEEDVSAFPQEVTGQMVANFLRGGAAISVLAKRLKADLQVIDVGILEPLPQQDGLVICRAGAGTANIANEPAMSIEQVEVALEAGRAVIDRITERHVELFIGGEMGIANTTSAAVLYCALLGLTPEQATGAGTGLDSKGILHKTNVVRRVLETHQSCRDDVLEWLRCAGGFEIIALVGAYIRASQNSLPILVDGFISSVSALCAVRLQPDVNDGLFFSHVSAEQGHRRVLETLNQKPLLDLGMRLGEGSGAAVAATILQSACVLHNQMATFEEAAVADKKYPS